MGIFSVVIDELESALNTVLDAVDITDTAKQGIDAALGELIGPHWEGDGAQAFLGEISEYVVDKLMEVLGFTNEFTNGIRKVLEFLRELDEALSNPIGAIGSIFGF